jgi:hypothetical protein
VTQWIKAGCLSAADHQKAHWLERSWKGETDPLLRMELATRADAYRALFETTYEGWSELNGHDPIYDRS